MLCTSTHCNITAVISLLFALQEMTWTPGDWIYLSIALPSTRQRRLSGPSSRISGHVKGTGKLPTVSSKHWRGSLAPSCLDWRTWTGASAPEESQQMKVTECHTQLGLWLRRWWFLGRAILLGANARESGLGQEWTKSDLTWIFIWQLRIYDSSTNLHERYANCLHGLSLESFFVVSMFIEGRDQTYAAPQKLKPILIYRRNRNH